MLALKNKSGIVEGSVPGLADMARLSLNDTLEALKTLSSPDEYSRTQEHEGRRIEAIDGGWLVLNHEKWRNKMTADERRDYLKIKQREHRERVNKSVNKCKQLSTLSTHTDKDTDTYAEASNVSPNGDTCPSAEEIYLAYPRHEKKPNAIRAIQKALKRFPADFILKRTKLYASTQPARSRFTPLPATWFNANQFNDDPKEWERDEGRPSNRPKQPWEVSKPKLGFGNLYPT